MNLLVIQLGSLKYTFIKMTQMRKVCKHIELFETWVKIETTNRVVN